MLGSLVLGSVRSCDETGGTTCCSIPYRDVIAFSCMLGRGLRRVCVKQVPWHRNVDMLSASATPYLVREHLSTLKIRGPDRRQRQHKTRRRPFDLVPQRHRPKRPDVNEGTARLDCSAAAFGSPPAFHAQKYPEVSAQGTSQLLTQWRVSHCLSAMSDQSWNLFSDQRPS